MPNYRVPGRLEGTRGLRSSDKLDYLGVGLTPYLATRVDASRGAAETVDAPDIKDNDIVKIKLEDGFEIWTSVAAAYQDYGKMPGGKAGERGGPRHLLMPGTLSGGRQTRGLGTWAIKTLEFFKVDFTEMVSTEIVLALENKFEKQLPRGPGLYRLDEKGELSEPAGVAAVMAEGPSLVFIHGTASCTEGGFGKLRNNKAWGEIREFYGNRVFAFEHRTLSINPIDNAIHLVSLLPKNAEIDIVSHSRGGIVAELLCRASRVDADGNRMPAFDNVDLDIFRKKSEEDRRTLVAELEAINKLGELLAASNLKIRHLVRAACPARGTTLASGRLDTYLSVAVYAMKLSGLGASPTFNLTMGLLLAVAKARTKPEEVPGLEAQMPTSPMVAMINRGDVILSSRLTIISGDIQGSGILGRLKVLATDLFYRDDHDLVVNTDAMYGGARRASGGVVMFDKGDKVNHFSYFGNDKTAVGIANALSGKTSGREGFKPLEDYRTKTTRTRALAARSGPSPVVYVLPGIMGSELSHNDDLVWFKLMRIMGGGIDRIAWKSSGVKPDGVFDDYYGDLVEFLSASHDAIAFDYDWRQSILTEAERLAILVEKKMKETSQPIRFIAHSMGGLVVRAMAAQKPELWNRIMLNPGARFVMLGTPNMGAFSTVATLLGRDGTIRKIATVDLKHDIGELLNIIAQYPGTLELLPRDGGGELYTAGLWQKILALEPEGKRVNLDAAALANAAKTWKLIEQVQLSGAGLAYVAGFDKDPTPMGLQFDVAGEKVKIMGTALGDGRVPWATGIPPGVPLWYVDAAHGNMPGYEKAFPAYLDLLATGKTTKLATTAPAVSRAAAAELREIEPTNVDIFPTERDLRDAVMGVKPVARVIETGTKIRVSIVHGDLNYARHPVAAGHYDGDTIRGAEWVLDRKLDGRLNRKRSLGLYPGKIETAEFVYGQGVPEKGALIVGLGSFGSLTPGSLRQTFGFALRKYGEECASTNTDKTPLELSTLLIGHRQSRLTLRDSISAMLQALIDAKLSLKDHAEFTEFQIIELYEDTAISALRILRDLKKEKRIGEHLEIEDKLDVQRGKQRRVTPEDESGWSRKIEIRGVKSSIGRKSLKFTLLSEAARASEVFLATQDSIIDPYLKSLTDKTVTNMHVAQTLFELMVPKEFKPQLSDDREIELILDAQAAGYPWELMADRPEELDRPPAVRAGMIRRLIDEDTVFQSVSASEAKAVVIGDSVNDPTVFAELKGAQEEAEKVAALLEGSGQDIKVVPLIKATCAEITEALLLEGAKILHVASHGVFEYEPSVEEGKERRMVTGIVLGEGAYFTTAEVAQIRPFPELVFLNCCYLGKISDTSHIDQAIWNNRHRLAGNLAHQFIKSGAKAVIAAGWSVDDNAAMVFATTFYDRLLSGETFGKAVHKARIATYDSNPGINTWGAYQCYGDPDYRLTGHDGAGKKRERQPSSEAEILMELENLAEKTRLASVRDVEKLKETIGTYHKDIEATWPKSSAARQTLANAYANVGMIDEAVDVYRSAISGKDGKSNFKAIEQFTNLSAKNAIGKFKKLGSRPSPAARKAAIKAILHADAQLEKMQGVVNLVSGSLVDTVERLNLRGAVKKRLATVETKAKRTKLLEEAAAFYEQAFKIAINPDSGETNAYYPGTNALLLKGLKKLCQGKPGLDTEDKERIALIRANFTSEDQAQPDFWALVAEMDLMVAECINLGALSNSTDTILKAFKKAWQRGGSVGEKNAVLEHLEFIVDCLEGVEFGAKEDVRENVRGLKVQVEGMG